jgi:putative tricarboxylic transport membrane protein
MQSGENGVWRPTRDITLVAGTPPGGGLDRVARSLAKAITEAPLLDVPINVINVPGDGARRVWTHFIDEHPGDGHVIGISSPNLTSDYLVGIANFEHTRYTPIATLVTEYIGFAVRADSSMQTGSELLDRLGRVPGKVTVALATALGNPNHVALAKLTRQAGGDVNAPVIRMFDTALDAVADVVTAHADVCAVTAASLLAELEAGRVRVLAVSAPERLAGAFAGAPTWQEQGVDCVIGAWRGVTGPAGLALAQIAFWQRLLSQAVAQPVWRSELSRLSWSPMYQDGPALRAFLDRERSEFIAVLRELGLLRSAGATPGAASAADSADRKR